MSNELWHALIGVGGFTILLLIGWRLNLHQPRAVIRAQFLMKERGLGSPLSLQERIGRRISLVKKLQGYFDIERLLIIANMNTTPQYWAVQTLGITLGVFGALLALEGLSYWQTGTIVLAFPMVFVITGIIPMVFFVLLRSKAQRKKADITLGIEDSLVEMAILSFNTRVSPREAMLMLARCHKEPALIEMLDSQRWLSLIPSNRQKKGRKSTPKHMATPTEYELMGKALGINILIELGSAIRQVQEKGSPPTEVYVRLATKVYAEKSAKAKIEASSAKTKTTIVMTLLIIPLLALIGAPLAAQFSAGFAK